MAVPKQRKTKSRRNQGRMHIFTKRLTFGACAKCGKPVLPHKACPNCGYYKSFMVVDVLKKLNKKEKKQKEREIAAQEKKEASDKPLTVQELSKK